MNNGKNIRETYEKNGGILKMIPTFVPRPFSTPGRRLRLHPDDYFALGTSRGAIKERWFTSLVVAKNGPLAAKDEGLSYVSCGETPKERFLFKDAVEELGAPLIGKKMQEKYGTWPMFAKFFDNDVPLFHHLHLNFEAAAKIGAFGKPECYFFPRQYNNYPGKMDVSYFGFDPDCTKEEVRRRIEDFTGGDNRITELSRAFRLELGTGRYTPMGVVHAPGSLLTYEPQWNSDVNAVFENVASGEVFGRDYLVENLPDNEKNDIDAIMDLLDWDANVDPHYKKHYFRPPVPADQQEGVYEQKWIVYANPYVGAKELTIYPQQKVTIKDPVAYGCVLVQGFGKLGKHHCETPGMIRFGQLTADEFFVGAEAAAEGITIENDSTCEPLVLLKHFGPNCPGMPQTAK